MHHSFSSISLEMDAEGRRSELLEGTAGYLVHTEVVKGVGCVEG